MLRTKRSSISSSKAEKCVIVVCLFVFLLLLRLFLFCSFFLVISLLLQFLFLFFLLCALEDEGKLYRKDIFTGRGVKSQAGLSWSHLAEVSKSFSFRKSSSPFLCSWSVGFTLSEESRVWEVRTIKRACELLHYCEPCVYLEALSSPRVFLCVLCYNNGQSFMLRWR